MKKISRILTILSLLFVILMILLEANSNLSIQPFVMGAFLIILGMAIVMAMVFFKKKDARYQDFYIVLVFWAVNFLIFVFNLLSPIEHLFIWTTIVLFFFIATIDKLIHKKAY